MRAPVHASLVEELGEEVTAKPSRLYVERDGDLVSIRVQGKLDGKKVWIELDDEATLRLIAELALIVDPRLKLAL